MKFISKLISYMILTFSLILVSGCDDSENKTYDWVDSGNDAGEDTGSDAGTDNVNNDISDAGDDADIIVVQDPPPNIEGTWAYLNIRASIINYPMIGLVNNRIISLLKYEITQDGTSINSAETVCEIIVDSSNDSITTIMPDAFVTSMPEEIRENTLSYTDGNWGYSQPKYWTTQGVVLTDVENEELPGDPEDPRVVDQDEDGHPGMTVRLTGSLSGELYVVQKGWTVLEPGSANETEMEGLVTWADYQVTVDASTPVLKINPETNPNPDPEESYYKFVKITADYSCQDISDQKETLFPLETF
ncbi:MAG: hypothetical protein JXR95_15170 [Deltaproteobacteria bacterium]|nr:hypothetical protein [Deltaproteobacteria bacterium]